ncbi:hypothetical protein [Hoeflea sp. IMCC20628]|uniref:hypothetical protein n=1 Tax=Hoeflea sp. IMCC20628 TaxID=1620421 RepID=UPI0012E06015|nr:hypothetical protein [Hoeflea sp. IMCC20628]
MMFFIANVLLPISHIRRRDHALGPSPGIIWSYGHLQRRELSQINPARLFGQLDEVDGVADRAHELRNFVPKTAGRTNACWVPGIGIDYSIADTPSNQSELKNGIMPRQKSVLIECRTAPSAAVLVFAF